MTLFILLMILPVVLGTATAAMQAIYTHKSACCADNTPKIVLKLLSIVLVRHATTRNRRPHGYRKSLQLHQPPSADAPSFALKVLHPQHLQLVLDGVAASFEPAWPSVAGFFIVVACLTTPMPSALKTILRLSLSTLYALMHVCTAGMWLSQAQGTRKMSSKIWKAVSVMNTKSVCCRNRFSCCKRNSAATINSHPCQLHTHTEPSRDIHTVSAAKLLCGSN